MAALTSQLWSCAAASHASARVQTAPPANQNLGKRYPAVCCIDILLNVNTIKDVHIEFDTAKQAKTLAERGLDFADASKVFAGVSFTVSDDRRDYGEQRWITMGLLDERVVVVVWTPRGAARRVISMRYANEREIEKYSNRVG